MYLKKLCNERDIFFVDNLRKTKAQHTKVKLDLNKNARILGKHFMNVISSVLRWKADGVNPNDSTERSVILTMRLLPKHAMNVTQH